MKRILINIITGLILFSSCQKNFLDKNPTDQISGPTFWKTDADLSMAVTGIYSTMSQRSTFNHGRMLWDGLSDIGYLRYSPALAEGIIEATSGGMVSGIYNDCYVGISNCNIFLKNADGATVADSSKVKYKAEVLFLRAYFYFILTEFYGGVPLYTTPPTIAESKVKQSTKAAVVAQILSDLETAIAGLPDVAYTGHAVKGAALALKAQVLMHNEKWAEAAAAAKSIIDGGIFSLYTGQYKNLFLAAGQDNNPEIIFSVRFLNPDASCPTTYDMNPDFIGGHSHTLSCTQQFVDAFECTDGLPISQSPLYDPANYLNNRDPRLSYNIRDINHKYVLPNGTEYNGESWGTNYSTEKYVNWSNAPYSWSTKSDQDYIVFRYAQVLLMYAECQNEAVGPDQSVYNAINQVRQRPGVGMPVLPTGLSQDSMRTRIRNERIVELGNEGLRYWDIKRWKIAATVIPTIVDPSGITRSFDANRNYLFPFPQSELDVNRNLVQNPGYN